MTIQIICMIAILIFVCVLVQSWLVSIVPNYVDILLPLQHAFIGLEKQEFDFLIFAIGFNKCGTSSLFNLMRENGIPSIHNTPCKLIQYPSEVYLERIMLNNYRENKSKSVLTTECTDYYRFYSDFGREISGFHYTMKRTILEGNTLNDYLYNKYIEPWYIVLDQQYPDSKYILNIRNVNNWLKSKYLHYAFGKQFKFNEMKIKINAYIDKKKLQRKHLSDIDILNIYKNVWYLYICNTIKYFKQNDIIHNLLIFDVESDSIDKLIQFFSKFGILLDKKHWIQRHKSSKKYNWIYGENDKLLQRKKWTEIENEYPQFRTNYTQNNNIIEYDRIKNQCKILLGIKL